MKLQQLHIFLILLLSLIFASCLGTFLREGMSSQRTATGSNGNSITAITGPLGNTAVATTNGVNNVPHGQEDLYILKSQIVPPVCPMCPAAISCPKQEKTPPCPPCARCPEPAFECKKVPNYASSNDNYLPRPVLADFSQFGM